MSGPPSMVMSSFASERKLSIEPANVEFARTHIPEQVAKVADARTAVKVMAELQDALTAHKAGDLSTYFHKLEGIARDLVGDAKRADFLKACANPPTGDLAMGAYREVGCRLVALTFASGPSSGSLARVGDDLSTHPAHVFIRSIARGVLNRLHTDSGGSVSTTEDHAAALAAEIRRIVATGTTSPGSDVLKMMNAFPNKGIQDNHGVVVAKLLKAVGSDSTALAAVAKILTDRLCQKPFVPPASTGLARVTTPNLDAGVPDAGIITLTRATGTMAPDGVSDPSGLSSGPNSNPWMSALGQAFQDLRGKCDKLRELFRSRPDWTADDWAVEAYNIIDPGMQLTAGQRPANGTALLLATIFATKLVEKYFVIDESVEHSQTRTLWERGLACAQTTLPWGVALGAFEAAYRLQPGDEKQKIIAGFSAARSAWEWTIEAARRQSTQAGIPPFVAPPTPTPAPTPTAPPVIDPHVRDLGYGKIEIDLISPKDPATAQVHDIVGGKLTICLVNNICTVQIVTKVPVWVPIGNPNEQGKRKFAPNPIEQNLPQYFDLAIPRSAGDMESDTIPEFIRGLRQKLQGYIDLTMDDALEPTPKLRADLRKKLTNVGSILTVIQKEFAGAAVDPNATFFGVVRVITRDVPLEQSATLDDPDAFALDTQRTNLTGIRIVGANIRAGDRRTDIGTSPVVDIASAPIVLDGAVLDLRGDCSFKRVGGHSVRVQSHTEVTAEEQRPGPNQKSPGVFDKGGIYERAAIVPPSTVPGRNSYIPLIQTHVVFQNSYVNFPILRGHFNDLVVLDSVFMNPLVQDAELKQWTRTTLGVSRAWSARAWKERHEDPTRDPTAFETPGDQVERLGTNLGHCLSVAALLHRRGIHRGYGDAVYAAAEEHTSHKYLNASFDYVDCYCHKDKLTGAVALLVSEGLAPRIVKSVANKRAQLDPENPEGDHTIFFGGGRAIRFTVAPWKPEGKDGPSYYCVTKVAIVEGRSLGEAWPVTNVSAFQLSDEKDANDARMWMIWEAIFDLIHDGDSTVGYQDKSLATFDEVRLPTNRDAAEEVQKYVPTRPTNPTPENDPFLRLKGLITGRDPNSGTPNRPGESFKPVTELLAKCVRGNGVTYLMIKRYAELTQRLGITGRIMPKTYKFQLYDV